MSTRTKKTTTTKSTDSRLEFANTLHALMLKQEAFTKSVEALQEFTQEELVKLDLEMQSKKEELKELDDKIKIEKKNKQIETDQLLAEYKYDGACKILEERHEVPIKKNELDSIQKKLDDLSKDRSEEIKRAVDEESRKGKDALKAAISNATLTHKAESAELNATVSQQKKEIENLQATIENMKHEIAEQRKLTMQVAQAGAKGNITQSFGK